MRDFYLCYPAILTNTLVPQLGLSSILQNQLGVALDALTVIRASTELAAHSQAPLPPDTTSQALLTQDELAISDEPCELQQQEGSCWSQVTVACFFICSLTV